MTLTEPLQSVKGPCVRMRGCAIHTFDECPMTALKVAAVRAPAIEHRSLPLLLRLLLL
jgi:hypothetical protein